MPHVIIELTTYEYPCILFSDRFALRVEELQAVLNHLKPGDNPLQVTAAELRDYLDGRGQYATVAVLAAHQQQIRELLNRIATQIVEDGITPEKDLGDELREARCKYVEVDRAYNRWST